MSALEEAIAAAVAGALAREREAIRVIVREELDRQRGTPNPDELIALSEAARLLGRRPGGLRKQVERGSFAPAPMRVGGRYQWRRGDIVAVVERAADEARRRGGTR